MNKQKILSCCDYIEYGDGRISFDYDRYVYCMKKLYSTLSREQLLDICVEGTKLSYHQLSISYDKLSNSDVMMILHIDGIDLLDLAKLLIEVNNLWGFDYDNMPYIFKEQNRFGNLVNYSYVQLEEMYNNWRYYGKTIEYFVIDSYDNIIKKLIDIGIPYKFKNDLLIIFPVTVQLKKELNKCM